jgi:hypothetical protein
VWAGILGEIFHPLLYQHRTSVIQRDLQPIFHGYR